MRSRLPSMKTSCSMPTWKLRLMNRNHELSEYKLGLLFWSNFLCGRRNFSHRLSAPLHLWKEEYDCWSHLCCSYRNRAPLPQEPFAVVRITSTWACGYIYISISAEWEKIEKNKPWISRQCFILDDTMTLYGLILKILPNSPGENM